MNPVPGLSSHGSIPEQEGGGGNSQEIRNVVYISGRGELTFLSNPNLKQIQGTTLKKRR
ncbi:hypothetical protein SacN8_10730 [Sulfolobus acidocaldarius N8]|uniref:Uncharacterized protein n=1 Tax=Sulfolobus acidocaldarius N8 TaxID=1028566 RepID=M1IU31_9CREN|nr:hypothetical protein SacN8_10730 [Sulfolobus acidocaldarius N8]